MEFVEPIVNARGQVEPRADDTLLVKFVNHPEYQEFQSLAAGRPIYKDIPHIEIVIPGGKDTIFRPVQDKDKQRFPREWEAFTRGEKEPIFGTPLKQWPLLKPSQIAVFHAIGIETVEQFAASDDEILSTIGMGARDLQQRARDFLSLANDSGKLTELKTENETLRSEMDKLRAEFAEFTKKTRKRKSSEPAVEIIEEDIVNGDII